MSQITTTKTQSADSAAAPTDDVSVPFLLTLSVHDPKSKSADVTCRHWITEASLTQLQQDNPEGSATLELGDKMAKQSILLDTDEAFSQVQSIMENWSPSHSQRASMEPRKCTNACQAVEDGVWAIARSHKLVPKSANDSDTVYDSTTHSFKFGPPLTDDEDTIELNPRVDHSIRGIAKALFDYPLTMLTEDGLKCDLTCPVGTKIDLTLQLCDTQILSTAREVFASEQSALRKGPPVSTVSQKTDATSTIPKAGQDVQDPPSVQSPSKGMGMWRKAFKSLKKSSTDVAGSSTTTSQ